MIKLIASDIDGTLLQDHRQEIPPRTAGLIRGLIDRGFYFAAASGRQYGNLRRMFAPISSNLCYIAENGCVCAFRDQIIRTDRLPGETVREIIDAIREFPDCYAMVSGLNTCYIDTPEPEFYHLISSQLQYSVEIVQDLKTDVREPVLKIAVCDLKGTDRIAPHFSSLYHGDIKAVTAARQWVDFVSSTANKGTGLKALLDYLGLQPSECIAFGDQYNDVEMLKLAGTGYVMTSSAPGMDRYADQVVDSVDSVLETL